MRRSVWKRAMVATMVSARGMKNDDANSTPKHLQCHPTAPTHISEGLSLRHQNATRASNDANKEGARSRTLVD